MIIRPSEWPLSAERRAPVSPRSMLKPVRYGVKALGHDRFRIVADARPRPGKTADPSRRQSKLRRLAEDAAGRGSGAPPGPTVRRQDGARFRAAASWCGF